MTTYYAVCNVYGPISVRIEAASDSEAREKFEALDQRAAIDEPRTDAEDDLDICGDGMSEEEFDAALEAAGYTTACDLSPIVNAHAGTVAHLADGWWLWRGPEEAVAGDQRAPHKILAAIREAVSPATHEYLCGVSRGIEDELIGIAQRDGIDAAVAEAEALTLPEFRRLYVNISERWGDRVAGASDD